MNLNELSKLQAELDLQINLEKQLNHADFLKEKAISLIVELGEFLNERPYTFKYWSSKQGDRDKALVEYVDGVHFLLSYGNSIKFDFESYKYQKPEAMDRKDLILGVANMFTRLPYMDNLEDALNHYLYLGETFRFTEEEVISAYYKKNEINHNRQTTGY